MLNGTNADNTTLAVPVLAVHAATPVVQLAPHAVTPTMPPGDNNTARWQPRHCTALPLHRPAGFADGAISSSSNSRARSSLIAVPCRTPSSSCSCPHIVHEAKQMFSLCRTCPSELLCFSSSVLTASCSSTATKTHCKYLLWRRCKINSEENKSMGANKPSGKPKGTESLYSTV